MSRPLDPLEEDMLSPKTVHVACFGGTPRREVGPGFGQREMVGFGRRESCGCGGCEWGYEFDERALESGVPELDVDVGLYDGATSEGSDETRSEGGRKRSWGEYDADEETDEDFNVEAWLDSKMESGDEEILYEMAKKAVEVMGYVL